MEFEEILNEDSIVVFNNDNPLGPGNYIVATQVVFDLDLFQPTCNLRVSIHEFERGGHADNVVTMYAIPWHEGEAIVGQKVTREDYCG